MGIVAESVRSRAWVWELERWGGGRGSGSEQGGERSDPLTQITHRDTDTDTSTKKQTDAHTDRHTHTYTCDLTHISRRDEVYAPRPVVVKKILNK